VSEDTIDVPLCAEAKGSRFTVEVGAWLKSVERGG
jgi:hypothetical protein